MISSSNRTSLGLFARAAALVFASIMLLAGCSGGDSASATAEKGPAATSTTAASTEALQGAGSTLINPIMMQWVDDYKKSGGGDVSYQSIGSGGGIKNLKNKTVSFAGSDAPMNAEETQEAKDPVLHFPAVIGAVAIAYNVKGVATGLHLTGPVIADIFMGKITKWNDPKIAGLNPSAKLPDADITVVHRSDGSGTTYIFSDYLSNVSADWKAKLGSNKSIDWPVGLGGKGSEGVAGLLEQHDNSIAYVELAHAVSSKSTYASVENSAGTFIEPSSDSASAAADGVKIPDDMKVSIVNTSNPKGYPITGFSYLVVYQTSPRGADLSKFIKWVLTDGQKSCTPLSYGPVPDSVTKRELTMLNSVR
jgi:phosphate transport system substrate-binding protein